MKLTKKILKEQDSSQWDEETIEEYLSEENKIEDPTTFISAKELVEDDYNLEIILAYLDLGLGDDDLSNFEEAFVGTYHSDIDFAQAMAEQLGSIDFKNQPWPGNCIDWEYAAKELMYDYSESNGYYFRNI